MERKQYVWNKIRMEVVVLKAVGSVFDVLEKLLKNICGVLVIGFSSITLISVIARYVFSSPLWWSEQLCRYLFIWMLMLYFPIIVRHEQNLGFDVLVKRLPKKIQDVTWLICNGLICAFGVYYLVYTVQLCQKFNAAHKILDGIRIPASVMYSSQAVGAIFLILFSLEVVINLAIQILHEKKDGEAK